MTARAVWRPAPRNVSGAEPTRTPWNSLNARLEADRELLRRFYLKHGYADVRIVSAVGAQGQALVDAIGTGGTGGEFRCWKITCTRLRPPSLAA